MEIFTLNSLPFIALATSMAITAGLMGPFAIMRKMALASDPISHIALPGLAFALILGINPTIGAAATLFLGAFIVWGLEKQTGISTEAMIGIVFSVSLALGSLLTEEEHLLEVLLGSNEDVGVNQAIFGIAVAIVIVLFLLKMRERLILSILSPELARTSGVRINRLNLMFIIAFVATILLGIHFLGVLLMGSLIIIPAAVGKNLGRSFKEMVLVSIGISIVSVILGLGISAYFGFITGPTIILTAAAIFLISLFKKRPE
ncbi:MAG: metal ABC transporter permease [Candidatus Colwellbacteria bacterium]|nr:metal ABC transporter permease [Candidatus Colwellbacteria bacterium]